MWTKAHPAHSPRCARPGGFVRTYRTSRAKAITIAQNRIVVTQASFPENSFAEFPQSKMKIV
jgi:hypothetical protein